MQRLVSRGVGVIAALVCAAFVSACGSGEESVVEEAGQALENERAREEAAAEEEEEGKKRTIETEREATN